MSEFLAKFSNEPGPDVEVPMWEWQDLRGTGILWTVGLGPCIGVSIYDPRLKHGYLGHFPDIEESESEDLNLMIESAKANVHNSAGTRIWIGGGDVTSDPHVEQSRIRSVRELGIVFTRCTVNINWLESFGSIQYALNVRTGEEEIIIREEDEFGALD